MLKNLCLLAAAASLGAACLSAQTTGYLKMKVDPTHAGVFVDGKYVGPAANFGASRKYALAPGQHQIKLVDPRYEEASATLTIEAGKTASLTQVLKVLPTPKGPFGVIRTHSADKYAAVYVNDHFMGHNDEFDNHWQGLKLPVGEYTVRIEPTNGTAVTKKVTVVADQTVMVE
jgi:hypothetical protein